jgi:hypothetical protein
MPNRWYLLAFTELEEKEIVPIPTLTALVLEGKAIGTQVSDSGVGTLPTVSEIAPVPAVLDPILGNPPTITVSSTMITYYILYSFSCIISNL